MSLCCTSPGHRPKTLRLFINRQNAIGFDEAESVESTQEIELTETSYDAEGTATVNLRFVKFQRVNSLSVRLLGNVILTLDLCPRQSWWGRNYTRREFEIIWRNNGRHPHERIQEEG
jgi:hypothetical protein